MLRSSEMCLSNFWVIFIFWMVCIELQMLNSQTLKCDSRDLSALQGFIRDLESPVEGWSMNVSSNCCEWKGITCFSYHSFGSNSSINSGRVFKLEIQGRKLNGELSESLGFLDQLRTLNISENFLRGSLPSSLFQLPNLVAMDLSSNGFSGLVPQKSQLFSLSSIDISKNFLSGTVPTGICENSMRLTSINFSLNNFSGNLLPGFGNCSILNELWLGSNFISGGLSDDLFRLSNLAQLSLRNNYFTGLLNKQIGNLSNLVRLDISFNGFSGKLPDVFQGFHNLNFFIANSNFFTDQLPASISNSMTLFALNLRNNSLKGMIQLNCSAMVSLTSLDMGSNQLYGNIPNNLPSCRLLQTVNLARNNLSGQVPESFKNFQTLFYISLSNTSLHNISSALDIFQHCKNLTSLVLTLNFRGETLPLGQNFAFQSLEALVIANCRLSGSIPQWLTASANLQLLDLSWNRLVGTIPAWLGDFESLFYLDLSNNSLTGEIPKSITTLSCLVNRTLLPKGQFNFPFFAKTNASLKGLQYNHILSFPPTIDLSYNHLSGEIFPEFGYLRRLHVLNLKFNGLSGSIPSNLSGMTSIESLDLSHNNLSGTIPPSLAKFSFLSMFNVAYNQLSGKIPSGGQFLTFQSSSFEGNRDLCGDHASKPCESHHNRDPFEKPSANNRNRRVIFGICVGGFILLVLSFVVVSKFCYKNSVDPKNNEDGEDINSRYVVLFGENNKGLVLVEDVLNATNNFNQSNIIGCGGFGLVYKATLPNGKEVAIKRLSGDCVQTEREFQAEVEVLFRARHPNLVLLQGHFRYKNDRLLIYPYMKNNCLDYWLHERIDGPACIDWKTRVRIVKGVANGLAYLHHSCEPHILHRDVKSSNILLDENFEAHLADFGLARLILPHDTHVTTDLVGTLGYIPPEYGQSAVATYKGDVFSFGVVLLEVLTARRPMDMCKPKGLRNLVCWVFQMRKENREMEVFDTCVYDKKKVNELMTVLDIACLCLSETPNVRPSTQQLVAWLANM